MKTILKRKAFLTILFFIAVFLFLLYKVTVKDKTPLSIRSSTSIKALVVRVIDGDTIIINGNERVRYIGIDTPEFGSSFYLEAKEKNSSLVHDKNVRLELCLEEKRDEYGRLLALVYVDDIMVNRELLKEGFARALIIPPCGLTVRDEFKAYELEAKKKGMGLWAGERKPIPHQEAHRFLGKVKRVSGRILGTYNSSKAIFLNFGEDYTTDFTAVIFSKDLVKFTSVGINPESYYIGKEIIVTGKIKEFNGPEIIVREPGQIEVLER